MGGVTDELVVQVISCTFSDEVPDLGHGHGSWRIVGPRYLMHELPGRVTLGRVATVAVYAQEDVDPGVLEALRVSAEWHRFELLRHGVAEEVAAHALPDLVMVEMRVTASLDELLRHLAAHERHSPACRTVDQGLAYTLAETAPVLHALLPDGVFGDLTQQEGMKAVD